MDSALGAAEIGVEIMANAKLKLWAGRTDASRGYHFVVEREVTEETAQQWLKVYRDDEPGVIFIVSAHKPKT